MIVNVKGHDCDLSKVLPLTLGDFKELLKIGCDLSEVQENKLMQITLFEYVLKKSNSEVTDDIINSLTASEFVEISAKITEKTNEVSQAPLENG